MVFLNICVLLFFAVLFSIQAGAECFNLTNPIPIDNTYYSSCASTTTCLSNATFRTADGKCNNLQNPLWGSTGSPYIRLAPANYDDDDHTVRLQSDGSALPEPRQVTLAVFMSKAFDVPDIRNFHLNQVGQWVTHDTTFMLPESSGPGDCCSVQNSSSLPSPCELIIRTDINDPIYSLIGKTCVPFRRASTSNSVINCTIKPQIMLNQASAYIDASQLYGHTGDVADSLRNKTGGRLKSEMINGQEFCVQQDRKGSTICAGRENVSVCFSQGDGRSNQHYGLLLYNALFTRFHNYLADSLLTINPQWPDEKLYQEARKIVIAVNQILIYRDYMPALLGASYAADVGLTVSKENKTAYDPSVMPQSAVEFVGGCFRVPHNVVPSKYYFVDENNQVTKQENLTDVMFYPDPIVEGTNFDDLLRGMSVKPGRYPSPSYNTLISNFMFHNLLPLNADQDLLSIDIQRGRDIGLPSYTAIRELCGFPKVASFDDLNHVLSIIDVSLLKSLYADVTDVDLLVGALLEPLAPEATVGETARCILTDGFRRLRYGDRFFFDLDDQPGSFTLEQLDVLWTLDLPSIFCAMSSVSEMPAKFFMAQGSSDVLQCKPLDLDLTAWTDTTVSPPSYAKPRPDRPT